MAPETTAARYRLLGPVRLGERTPSAAKLRVVAATLLIRAGDVVSADCLIEELWGEHPPRTATTTLHVYVSQLRKLLEPAAGGPIVTRAPGYVMQVGPDEVDLTRFETLRRDGRAALQRRDHAEAARLLRAATALWSGPPLADIPHGPVLMSAAARLQELQLDALEHLFAAELQLGHHREIIAELLPLADEHQLRERLHAQLMLALHRSGRQADALRVFGRVRRRLADELGTDPGADLRELHQRILRFDPGLDWRGGGGARPPEPIVWLPRPVADFVGRDAELARAVALLGDGGPRTARVLSIAGKAGVGKTAFVLALAHRLSDRFRDGRLFVSLRSSEGAPLDAAQSVQRLLRAFPPGAGHDLGGDFGGDLDGLLVTLQRVISGRRLLIVLDDVVTERQIRGILAATGECTVLITGRRILTAIEGARHVVLPVLDQAAAYELLAATGGERVAADRRAAAHIARQCGYLPLALRVAGASLAMRPQWTAATLARRLTDEPARLSLLTVGDIDVRSNLLAGYREVSPAAQRAMRLLGVAPAQDFAAWTAAALLGAAADDAEQAITELVHAQLLEHRSVVGRPGRFGFHVLLRALAVELLAEEPADVRAAAVERWCRTATGLARHADALLTPGRALELLGDPAPLAPDTAAGVVGDEPLRWFDLEAAGLVTAVRRAHAAGLWPLVWRLADALSGYFQISAGWDDWGEVIGLALDAARRAGNGTAEAVAELSLGELAWQRRQVPEATAAFERAHSWARSSGCRPVEAHSLIGLADVSLERGLGDQARRLYAQGLILCRADGDVRGATDALRGLALVELRRGERDAALHRFAECGRAADQLGDPRWREFAHRVADRIRREPGRGGLAAAIEMRPGVWMFGAA
ncbi:BTAD domain-containing putative transcriptional regulator [Dactylosporangium sp. NPDC050688]|uniref:AfsR/SARP family transcriptional regulator n=1 Tax=Dactylosporangium sp. NPDC050688 TaxID=3157217 RepID=UPI003408B8A3